VQAIPTVSWRVASAPLPGTDHCAVSGRERRLFVATFLDLNVITKMGSILISLAAGRRNYGEMHLATDAGDLASRVRKNARSSPETADGSRRY